MPAGFWEADAIRAALASWHMGRVVAAYRRHPFHGVRPLSQELVAGWLAITQTQLSRLENGPPIRDLDRLVHWARVLRIPARLLWFKLPEVRQPSPTAEEPRRVGSNELPAVVAAGEAVDVQRDQFLRLAGATLAGALAPPLVHGWPDQAVEAPRLTGTLLAQARAQTEGFRWLDRRDGAFLHLPSAADHARTLVSYWQQAGERDPLRASFAEAAADACHLVAYQSFDQGQRPRAVDWYQCAADLAARAAAQDLYVFAVCGVAYMHARNGDGDLARGVLGQLARLCLSAAAHCYVAVYEAHAHAADRDLDAVLRALDRATAWAQQVSDEAPSPWLGIPDQSFVERQRAMILAQFGIVDALVLLERLGHSTPAVFRRYRVTVATDRALVLARTGQVEEAASVLGGAFTLNQRVRSVEKAANGRAVRAILDPYQDSKAVRELDETIRAADQEWVAAARRPVPPISPAAAAGR